MSSMADNEQWKSDGMCDKCRKNEYCQKTCTACKVRLCKAFQLAKTAEEKETIVQEVKNAAHRHTSKRIR